MSASGQSGIEETSLARDLLVAARYYLGGRRGLLMLAAVGLAGGLAFNWSWLVAAGIAPLILAALPCVAMCALGLCMNKIAGRSCPTETEAAREIAPSADAGAIKPILIEMARLESAERSSTLAAGDTAMADAPASSTEERRTAND